MIQSLDQHREGPKMLRYYDDFEADNYDEEEMTDEERRAARDEAQADRHFARMDD
jgi:hypothetical protein